MWQRLHYTAVIDLICTACRALKVYRRVDRHFFPRV